MPHVILDKRPRTVGVVECSEGVYILLSMRELGNEYAKKAICLLILLCCACDL